MSSTVSSLAKPLRRSSAWLGRFFATFAFLAVGVPVLALVGELHASLALAASIPIVILLKKAIASGSVQRLALPLAFSAGNFLCWGFGLLGCHYLGLKVGRHTHLSLGLLNVLLWGVTVGSLAIRRDHSSRQDRSLPGDRTLKVAVVVSGAISVVYMVLSITSGFLMLRLSGKVPEPNSSVYYLIALGVIQYPFFFYAGCRSVPGFRFRNLAHLALLLISMVFSALSGGRESSLRMLLVFASGMSLSAVGTARTWRLLIALAPVFLVFMVATQFARGSFDDRALNLDDRLRLLGGSFANVLAGESAGEDFSVRESFFLRVFEPTGQLVVDGVAEGRDLAGLENFERFWFVFLPKLVAPNKRPLDDGPEILSRDYDVLVNEYTSAPITFLADAYRRGGWLAVALAGVIAGAWLALLGDWIRRLSRSVAILGVVLLSLNALRLYPVSVLGFASSTSYAFARDLLMVWAIAAISARLVAGRVLA